MFVVEICVEMAFRKSLGGLLRQGSVSQTGNVPVQSMLGSLRYMSTKLFVGGKYLGFPAYEIELLYFQFENWFDSCGIDWFRSLVGY